MLADIYVIRAGAQQFASAADGMRQKANRIDQNTTTLTETWQGQAADAFRSVSDWLGHDVQTASHAFEQASHALHTLAGQLDHVNALRRQADSMQSQIQSLEMSLWGADDARRASIHSEISQLSYRREQLVYEADSTERQANAAASAAFHEIAGMVNQLYYFHGTQVHKSGDSTWEKVGHFFSGLWHKTESAVEDAFDNVSKEFQKDIGEVRRKMR